ncbi:hypothetical protein AB0469_35260 [Streptomyces sp. NPDC093801]|uniref:hypothetical protein n=1 Tax=Streptomyces sp. NPDC093801 TaxID=3155203 RepID=UPI0034505808
MEKPRMTEAERRAICQEITATVGLEPRLNRLLTAVHEAGHAIVGHTVGFKVAGASVVNTAVLGLEDGDRVDFDFSPFGDGEIPLSDLLAMRMAGFQATHMWLRGRGAAAGAPEFQTALNMMSSSDIVKCYEHCAQVGMPAVSTTREGLYGGALILKWRWRAVLRLAYVLARVGTLDADQLRPHLDADLRTHQGAVDAYRAWQKRTSSVWMVQETAGHLGKR